MPTGGHEVGKAVNRAGRLLRPSGIHFFSEAQIDYNPNITIHS